MEVVSSLRRNWPPRSPPEMLPDIDVPALLRRNHVKSGYRPLNRSILYYARSAFLWHNELINVWTHAIPLVLLYVFWILPELASERPRASVLFSYAGVATLFLCSALTHLMHSRSYVDHVFWLLIDFSGIALFSMSIGATRFICRPENSILFTSFYVPTLTAVILIQYLSTCAFFVCFPFWKTRHLIRIFTCGLVAFWIYVPLFDRYLEPVESDISLVIHSRGFQWLLVSGIFMGCNWPEAMCPGKFDLVGYGHQIFHICIMMVGFCVCETAHLDCPERTTGPLGLFYDPYVTPLIWISTLAVVTCAVTISVFLNIARRKNL